MIVKKKNTETFYLELRSLLPEIACLDVWKEFDDEGVGFVGAQILTIIGEQAIRWAFNDQSYLIVRLFEFFELSYKEFDDGANAYIYTDFLPTVIAFEDVEIREQIKKHMGENTRRHYDELINLGFYAES